jgi:two-component system, NarL family, response regulator DegU
MIALTHKKITLGIVDDSKPYREALFYYFSQLPDIEVVFECIDGRELIAEIENIQPQAILLDIDMPDVDGMTALKLLRHTYPSVKFIVLTMFMEKALISSYIEAGANSYLNKSATAEEIYTAIVKCCEADFYMNEWISDALVSKVKRRV